MLPGNELLLLGVNSDILEALMFSDLSVKLYIYIIYYNIKRLFIAYSQT